MVRLRSAGPGAIQNTLAAVADDLAQLDTGQLAPGELFDEYRALVELYRAVRGAHAEAQRLGRDPELADRMIGLYYALRSAQAALSMAYAVAGPGARAPDLSPVGTAIGLFDAPKVLAQETHLMSGTYDADLAGFARWMVEIWTDMSVRAADYRRFYGEPETEAARAALRCILSLDEHGEPMLLALDAAAPAGPAALRERLLRWASDGRDVIAAVHAIQEVGHQARLALISVLAYPEQCRAGPGPDVVAAAERVLAEVVNWPFPVEDGAPGGTPRFDLDAEQAAFDALLARVPNDLSVLRAPAQQWAQDATAALTRACAVEQSLRDDADWYRAQRPGSRRRSLRWYVWEFLHLAQQAGDAGSLGARR